MTQEASQGTFSSPRDVIRAVTPPNHGIGPTQPGANWKPTGQSMTQEASQGTFSSPSCPSPPWTPALVPPVYSPARVLKATQPSPPVVAAQSSPPVVVHQGNPACWRLSRVAVQNSQAASNGAAE